MLNLLVVCEASADSRTSKALADRVFLEHTTAPLDDRRIWSGQAGRAFIKWTEIKTLWGRRRQKFHGKYKTNKGEYIQARKALRLIESDHPGVNAVVLVRDDDGHQRRTAYEDARKVEAGRLEVVLAIVSPEREAWHIVGFKPQDADERKRLEAEQARLGFNPQLKAHTLNPKRDEHPRSTKRVLDALTGGDRARETTCLHDRSLDELRQQGEETGLSAYLNDLSARLVPLLSPS